MASQDVEDETTYKIKRVSFLGREDVPVFCQSLNGPCPLLAIANVLSLRNQLSLPSGTTELSHLRLMSMVAERILDSNSSTQPRAAEFEANLRANIEDAFNALRVLGSPGSTGMDVNIRFDTPFGFEPTREVAVFDLLGIDLVHGWLVDPQDQVTAHAVGSKTYNQAVEMLINSLDSAHPSFSTSHPPASLPPTSPATASEPPIQAATINPAPQLNPPADADFDLLGLDVTAVNPNANPVPVSQPQARSVSTAADMLDALFSLDPTPAPAAGPPAPEEQQQPQPAEQAAAASADALQPQQVQEPPAAVAAPAAAAPATAVTDADLLMFDGLDISGAAAPAAAATGPSSSAPAAPDLLAAPAAAGTGPASKGERPPLHETLAVREFLDNNASQLTVYGISQIASTLNVNALAVFFRNNHFNCMFKHGRSLFLLVTDQGYLNVKEVMWERLDTVDGDTQLCGPDFLPHKARQQQPRQPQQPQLDMAALQAAIPPGALDGLSEADAAAIAEAAGVLMPARAPVPSGVDGEARGTYQPPPMDWPEDGTAGAQHWAQQPQHQPGQHHAGGRHNEDADLALAMQLQEEEEAEARRAEAEARARASQQPQAQQQHMQAQGGQHVQSQQGGQQRFGGGQPQQQQQYYASAGAQSVRPVPRPVQPEKKEESSCNIM